LANSVCGLKGIRVLSLSSGVSSVFTRDAEWPGNCGWAFFIAGEVDGVGAKRSGGTTMVHVETVLKIFFGGLPDLGLFSSTAEVSASRLKDFYIFTPRGGILLSLCLDDIFTVNLSSICPVGHALIWHYCLQGTRRMFLLFIRHFPAIIW
jgi:hypothetical protein